MTKKETKAIQGAQMHGSSPKAVTPPLYLSSTFIRNDDGSYDEDYIYTREDNPNRRTLEKCMADLEGGDVAFAFSSGMAATQSVLQSLQSGDHVIIPDDAYYAVNELLSRVFKRWGLTYTRVNMTDLKELAEAINPQTKLIWIETPSNPQLKITDIQAVCSLAKTRNILTCVDNTWPSPLLQNPIELGADIVVHSSTKYLGGHSDVLGGVVVIKDSSDLIEKIKDIQHLGGGVPSPFDCWLVSRGIQTLSVRLKQQSKSAQLLAEWLEKHPKIEQVLYPGLETHHGHSIASKQMKGGFGGMLSIRINENVERILEISNRLEYFTTATSLGGVESLVEHRYSTEGPNSQSPENLLRLSVGLENVEDLIKDWERALM